MECCFHLLLDKKKNNSFIQPVIQHRVWTSYSSGLRSTKMNKIQAESVQTLLVLNIHRNIGLSKAKICLKRFNVQLNLKEKVNGNLQVLKQSRKGWSCWSWCCGMSPGTRTRGRSVSTCLGGTAQVCARWRNWTKLDPLQSSLIHEQELELCSPKKQ